MRSPQSFLARLTAGIIAAILGSACLVGCKPGYLVHLDTRPNLDRFAKVLKPHAPPTKWEQAITQVDTDLLEPIGTDRVFVGLLDVSSWTDSPSYGPCCALEAATGRRLWCFERDEDTDVRWSATVADGNIIMTAQGADSARLVGLKAAGGEKVLDVELKAPVQVKPTGGDILTLEPNRIALFDGSGRQHWAAAGEFTNGSLHLWGELAIVVVADQVSAFSFKSGKREWTAAGVRSAQGACPPVFTEQYAVIPGEKGKAVALDRRGKVLQSWQVGEPVLAFAANDNNVIVATGDRRGRLMALSLEAGERRWEVPLDGPLMSSLAVSNKFVALTVANSLWIIDAGAGTVIVKEGLAGLPKERAPDLVAVREDRVIISAETAAGAFNATDGSAVWKLALRGASQRSLEAMLNDSEVVLRDTMRGVGMEMEETGQSENSRKSRLSMSSQSPIFQAMRNSLSEHQEEREQIIFSLNVHHVESGQSTAEAAMAAGAAIGIAIAGAINDTIVEAAADRRKFAFAAAITAHLRSVQNDYIVRPIRLKLGDGLLVVRIADGAWAEVPIAPFESTVGRDVAMDTSLGLISNGRFLITKGISLNAASWQPEEDMPALTTVNRSLLGYELTDIKFHPPAEYDSRSLARPMRH